MLFVIILVMIYTANCEQKAEKNTEKANNNWRNCAPFAAFPDKIPSIFRRKTTMSRMCGTTESGRTDPAVRRARRLTETAVMTALLIVLQAVTKPAGQYITGTCVNAVLAVSVLAAGLWSGITVALLSPLFAFLLGIGPQLPPIVPSIAVGNLVFVLLLGLLAGGGEPPLWKRTAAWLLAAAAKFGVLYLLVVKLLCVVLPLQEPQAAAFSAMFSYPQLITALAGGAAGLFLSPLLRRASRRSPVRD